MHILVGILLLVILYLLYNKKENYDDVQVTPPEQAQQFAAKSSELSERDNIINNIKLNENTLKYLRFLLSEETDDNKVKEYNAQILQTNMIIDNFKNDLLKLNTI